MKKVLLISQRHSIFTDPLTRAFQYIGWDIRFADYLGTPLLMTNTLTQRIFDKLPNVIRDPIRRRELRKVDDNILRIAREYVPDLIFVSKGKSLGHEMLDELRRNHIVVNWYPETMDHWQRISSIAPHYSYFFSFDPMVVDELKRTGYRNAYYVPFCADILKSASHPEPQYRYPVSFIGSFDSLRYGNREKILSTVRDLGLHVWGNKAWLNTSLKNFYHGYPSHAEMIDIYRKSKVVISMHVSGVLGSGVNVRPFEITSAGAFLLNHDERKDIFDLFTAGKEFIPFHDEYDIREKVAYYLSHDDERKRIAMAGFERTRSQHTYLDRVNEVLKIVGLSA